ncbi:MAG: branched-chain amino acid ABC transporter permease [Desulfosalsimonas sp.]
MVKKHKNLVAAAAVVILLLVLPAVLGKYNVYILTKIIILSLYAVAFNILLGFTGLLSFGHALFFSGAAYTVAICLVKLSLPLWLSLVLAVAVVLVLSAATGFLSLRHHDIHFALITLSLSMLFWGLAMKWRSVTGGEDGITGISRMMSLHQYYYLVLPLAVGCILIIYRMLHSNFGLLLEGLRENETRVSFSGHSVVKYRMYAMILSAFFTAIAGMLWLFVDGGINPNTSHWTFSAVPVIASLIGGPAYFTGPIIGVIVYMLAMEIITSYTLYWQLFLGIVIVMVVLFFRGGIVGSFKVLLGGEK